MLISHVRADNTAVFMYPDPHHGEVFVTGDFNGWSAPGFPMQRIEGGWRGEVPDFPQGEFAYKFVVDGHWIADPFNAMTVDDGIGGENSIITHRVNRGSLFHFNFYSPAIDDYRGYVIYLPPGYFLSEDHYSTIYLLHGALDWEYTWAHKGYVHFTMDQLRSQGKAGEMIIVMPKENGEFHGGDNRFADYIYRDLVGHVDFEFKTIAHPKHRAIDGLSTGGFASIVLGSGHPYVFSSVGAMSGSYDQRVFDSIRHNAEAIKKYDVRFHISCGHGDASADVSRALAEAIRSEGIYVEYYQNPGPHDWEFWGPAIAGNLEFHWWSFQR